MATKKKAAKKEKKIKTPLTVQAEKVNMKNLDKPAVPAPVKTKVIKSKLSTAVPATKAVTRKNEGSALPVTETSSNGVHNNENKEV